MNSRTVKPTLAICLFWTALFGLVAYGWGYQVAGSLVGCLFLFLVISGGLIKLACKERSLAASVERKSSDEKCAEAARA